ncbi:MAG TPA: iron-containing alcohol dehydrogenase [Rectinemataceae bacterium]|nr:iron-containing alcohol dehydrogenase [Rectinemataceae bacterium]
MFTFNSPTKLVFGNGVADSAAKEIAAMGARKVLIVTGPGRTASSEALGLLKQSLEAGGVAYFHYAGAGADPSTSMVDEGAALYRREACDAILGYGGGSPLDCAKGIGASIGEGRPIRDFVGTGLALGARPVPPLVAIPTTAGTGSEVTSAAVFTLTDGPQKAKKGISGQSLYPRLALVDPLLQASMPPELTAATGMDALTHAVEAYVSRSHTPVADLFCLEAIRLIGENLKRAHKRGDDLDARAGMALASTMAGVALSQAGLGMVHGFAHAVGALVGLPHGLANAIILPYVMQACIPDASIRLSIIGKALTGRHSATAIDAVSAMAELGSEIGIPPNLFSAGVSEDLLRPIFDDAKTYKRRPQSPHLFTDEELKILLRKAWSENMAG